jgi:hypothetical protein
MRFVSAFFRAVVGLIFGFLAGVALIPALAAFSDGQGNTAWIVFVVAGLGGLLGFFAPTVRRAFGRGFLLTGVAVFVLPLSMMMLSGRVANQMMAEEGANGATALGAGIAGTMATGLAGFVGFFFGAVLLIIGLVLSLGGRREVYVVERPAPATGRREPRF